MKLIEYLPPVLKEIYEFKILSNTEDIELEKIKESIAKSTNEMFVYRAENEGLKRLESMLNLYVESDESLDFRRFNILTKLNGGNRDLIKKIKLIAGDDFEINYYWRSYRLTVKLPLKNKKYLEAVKNMLENTVPLNLIIEAILKYNTYGMVKSKFTYGGLKGMTFKEIREEELK